MQRTTSVALATLALATTPFLFAQHGEAGAATRRASTHSPRASIEHLEQLAEAIRLYERALEVTAENMVNADTTAYDRVRPRFHHSEQGLGLALERIVEQGRLVESARALDMAIDGEGYFMLQAPHGEVYYTRDGAFHRHVEGHLVSRLGLPLVGSPTIPTDVPDDAIVVGRDGRVSANAQGALVALGTIQLACFTVPSELEPALGQHAFRITDASGHATQVTPGSGGPAIVQRALESSNVSFAEERARERHLQRRLAELLEVSE